ncbi:MAG: hypothetical protein H0V17_28135 [Deltaproteobacteria bacterium]|nr:hypothetical protein [Deltaproteobacteria bacterium]
MREVLEAFRSGLPAEVREVIDQAERGLGPAVVWLRGMPPLPLSECLRMLNETRIPSHVLGWLIAMTMFGGDPRQQLASALGRRSFRDDVIPHVLLGLTAGIVRGQPATTRLWTSIEMLAGRVRPADARCICDALPIALMSAHAVVRGCALRLAHELGAAARAAIVAANTPENRALDDALIALAGGEPPPANTQDAALLGRLLDAWRATHDPTLERAILRVGADLARARGPIVAKSIGELEAAWHAVAANQDPIDVSRLLEQRFPLHWKRTLDRVTRLAELPPDPRIAIRLADLARTHSSRSSRPLHVAIAQILADTPTASALPGIDAVITTYAMVYARARASIGTIAIRPANPELLALAGSDRSVEIDALYAQHALNPGDLEARAVLADALQAAGDPRGELITLQLAIADGTGSVGAERRVASLLAVHADAWTGPLPGIERGNRRFERGFLVACETSAESSAIARTLERPEWRTIEELTLRAQDLDLAPLLVRLPLLRRLCAHDRPLDRFSLAAPPPVRRLSVIFTHGTWIASRRLFPDLAVFGGCWFTERWSAAGFAAMSADAAGWGLHAIVHTAFPGAQLASAIQVCRSGPPETRFTLGAYRTGFTPLGWRLRVRRDDPVVDVAWTYHRWADNIVDQVFGPLAAAGVTEVALHVPEMLRVHLDRLIESRPHGIEVIAGQPIDLIAHP